MKTTLVTETDSQVETLKREAFGWISRLTSGDATGEDAAAFNRWRSTSEAHRLAFSEAKLLWTVMRPAAKQAMGHGDAVNAPRPAGRRLGRRAFLGGAVAASAAGVALMAARPPLGLWPSFSEFGADYRTATGEQRRVELTDNVSVELNTQTSIALRSVASDVNMIELISGEAAIATDSLTSRLFVVIAGGGRATARRATFNMRHTGSSGLVTCLNGEVLVEYDNAAVTLMPQQQVTYDRDGLTQAAAIDPAVVAAWRQGLLVFRSDPLSRVIDEVNRYRPGRIILMNSALGRQKVFASFRIDRIDEVVPRLQAVLNFQARTLPGGVVLLS